MYKIGDKVETPLGVGKVSISATGYMVNIKGYQVVFEADVVTPYQSAHDKLLAMGYEFNKRNDYVIYTHDELSRVTIYRDKTYSCGDANLTLSRILTAYLEELEGKE